MCRTCAETMSIGDPAIPEASAVGDLLPLVRAALDGDRQVADRLYELVRPRLLRIALALGADPETAADTVQESLWAAHRSLSRFDPSRASFQGWLGVILTRRLRNQRRAAARRMRMLEALRVAAPRRSDRGQPVAEARITLRRLLEELTDRQREVIALYEIGELSAAEVARALDLTPAGVRSIARDARRRLTAAALTPRGPGEAGR
jgi:RNA polymerase sigma-70 factor (ECF subfamily)